MLLRPMASLCVQDLAVVRGDRTIISGLGFAVEPGEVLHLQGRNGAGKTSLLEVLCGLRQPEAGRILGQPEADQRHWLGHKNGLNPLLTPMENLEFWAGLNGLPAHGLGEALNKVGLNLRVQRNCGSLSTGQRRRAAMARLLVAPRPWWFLDEPLSGLDVDGLAIFGRLLTAHVSAGGAVVVTSHQPLPGDITGLRSLRLER
ncbi:MAG: heme ABC exporter ATP-binding protein CcmA [Nevskia sp.]|nr:heme ABC exporter ATP-binding protein CcmA [Nevskia sp.]